MTQSHHPTLLPYRISRLDQHFLVPVQRFAKLEARDARYLVATDFCELAYKVLQHQPVAGTGKRNQKQYLVALNLADQEERQQRGYHLGVHFDL